MALVAGCIAAIALAAANRLESIPPQMTGAWSGEARIAVSWTTQKTLAVRVIVAQDGTVTGVIGDATLRDGRLQRNRTALGRTLRVKTDWIISGTLDGPIIAAESIQRDSVKLPLNWADDHFEGSVNTSGSELGGKQSMWLAAQNLRLDREAAK